MANFYSSPASVLLGGDMFSSPIHSITHGDHWRAHY